MTETCPTISSSNLESTSTVETAINELETSDRVRGNGNGKENQRKTDRCILGG